MQALLHPRLHHPQNVGSIPSATLLAFSRLWGDDQGKYPRAMAGDIAAGATASDGPAGVDVRQVETPEQLRSYMKIRHEVCTVGNNVPPEEEVDDYDGGGTDVEAANARASHFMALIGGLPAGAGRFVHPKAPGEKAKVGRIATLKEFRRRGVARAVMLTIHEHAQRMHASGCYLGAQLPAISFYETLGYTLIPGEVFLDAGLEHRWMELSF